MCFVCVSAVGQRSLLSQPRSCNVGTSLGDPTQLRRDPATAAPSHHPLILKAPSPSAQAWVPSSMLPAAGWQGHRIPAEQLQHLLLSRTCPVASSSTCQKWNKPLQCGWSSRGGREAAYHKPLRSAKEESSGRAGPRCRKQPGYLCPILFLVQPPRAARFKARDPTAGILLPLSSTCVLPEGWEGRQRSLLRRKRSPEHAVRLCVPLLQLANCVVFWAPPHLETAAG